MAVLIEGITVIIKAKPLLEKYPGGWEKFLVDVPNNTLCYDDEIVAVAFMFEEDACEYIYSLEKCGLVYLKNGAAQDLDVVSQVEDVERSCPWLEFGNMRIDDDPQKQILICSLKETQVKKVVLPGNWNYEHSLSKNKISFSAEEAAGRFVRLKKEDGIETYYDLKTGKEAYAGRTKKETGQINDHNEFYSMGCKLIEPYIEWADRPFKKPNRKARNKLKSGIEYLDAVTKLNSRNYSAFWLKGKAYQALNMHAEAYKEFKESFNVNMNNPDITREFNLECLRLGFGEEAVSISLKAYSLSPEDAGLLSNLALSYLINGNINEAKKRIDRALEMDPEDRATQALSNLIDEIKAGKREQPHSLTELERR
ncbi:MAG TPA: hypothetical protein VLB50_00790 [Ignavibacteriaceae bacterium]|nr:hypothetical protein [Ignavibacteriaceae bacterium]